MKPHKHAALIKAWADGAKIERKSAGDWVEHNWCDLWHHDYEYRIKPEPKPDVVKYCEADIDEVGDLTLSTWASDNLKLTFDGNTKKLIKAEVI